MAFGFENFLLAAMTDPDRFDQILDQFTEISIANLTEWVKDDCPICVCHDDLAIGQGLVFPPDWYRKHIFPRYERIFEPIKNAGKKLVFVSDGNYMDLIDDLLALGADGLLVDCFMDLQTVLKKCGPGRIVIGNIDTRILTNGTRQQILTEVKRCAEMGKAHPGYFFRAAGDLPHNIPLENMRTYFGAKQEFCQRK
jgi:uroporphyrinogen-III decarboxylase